MAEAAAMAAPVAPRKDSLLQPEEEDPAEDTTGAREVPKPSTNQLERGFSAEAAAIPAVRASRAEPRPRSVSAATGASSKLLVDGDAPRTYGATATMQRRHSILRLSSMSAGMKKSASVEFILSQEEQVKIVEKSIHLSGTAITRDKTPRRLTFEEKEELYRVRPDLEIGPVPYFNEKLAEMNSRNQRRIIFAMFGGMLSIVLLLIIYSVLAGAGQM